MNLDCNPHGGVRGIRKYFPFFHKYVMFFHMKTTLIIDDQIMRRLKAEAAKRKVTLSSLVEAGVRDLLERGLESPSLPPLPTFDMGKPRLNLADRDALYRVMDNE